MNLDPLPGQGVTTDPPLQSPLGQFFEQVSCFVLFFVLNSPPVYLPNSPESFFLVGKNIRRSLHECVCNQISVVQNSPWNYWGGARFASGRVAADWRLSNIPSKLMVIFKAYGHSPSVPHQPRQHPGMHVGAQRMTRFRKYVKTHP